MYLLDLVQTRNIHPMERAAAEVLREGSNGSDPRRASTYVAGSTKSYPWPIDPGGRGVPGGAFAYFSRRGEK